MRLAWEAAVGFFRIYVGAGLRIIPFVEKGLAIIDESG